MCVCYNVIKGFTYLLLLVHKKIMSIFNGTIVSLERSVAAIDGPSVNNTSVRLSITLCARTTKRTNRDGPATIRPVIFTEQDDVTKFQRDHS